MALLQHLAAPKSPHIYGYSSSDKSSSRRRKSCPVSVIRCCHQRAGARAVSAKENYYELLGVSVHSNMQEIKEAYRKLQKKYHPDIAGQEGHERSTLLNEAYRVLMEEELRKDYDVAFGRMKVRFGDFSGLGYSSWRGPPRPQALFIDENACIGCRQCVNHASNTFVMDETAGSARVKVQYGDDDQKIEVSVDSCPVNCIHWVDKEELPVLEFVNQPQADKGYGVFGGGWKRPANVFTAAKTFSSKLKEDATAEFHQRTEPGRAAVEEETPAQAEAREKAAMELKMEKFNKLLSFFTELFGPNLWDSK